MQQVNIHEAKTNLSRLVETAAKGQPFIIARAGKPLVKVIPYEQEPLVKKRIGFLQGQFGNVANVKDIGNEEIEAMFEVQE